MLDLHPFRRWKKTPLVSRRIALPNVLLPILETWARQQRVSVDEMTQAIVVTALLNHATKEPICQNPTTN